MGADAVVEPAALRGTANLSVVTSSADSSASRSRRMRREAVANRRRVRCLAAGIVAGLVWGVVPPRTAWEREGGAPGAHDGQVRRLGDRIAEVERLLAEKKYVEGKAAAREMFALAEQILGPEHEAIAKLYAGQALLFATHKLDAEAE